MLNELQTQRNIVKKISSVYEGNILGTLKVQQKKLVVYLQADL